MPDAQGSVRNLTDATGAVTDTYRYTAYGELYDQSGLGTTNHYRYTGQQYNALTGLYSLRARYYDPGTGRFLSRDTWPLDTFNPVELNRYQYAMSNPITFGDPSGYFATLLNYIQTNLMTAVGVAVLGTAVARLLNNEDVIDAVGETIGNETQKFKRGVKRTCQRTRICRDPNGGDSIFGFAFKVVVLVLVTTLPLTLTGDTPQPQAQPETDPEQNKDCDPAVEDCDCEQTLNSEECDNKAPFIVRHYTNKAAYQTIVNSGFIMNPSPPELTMSAGIYFIEASVTFPLEGKLYHPRHIAIGLGIATEPERAEYYIDVDKNRLKGIWRNRIMVGNLEHVYVTPIPVSVAHAVADHGSVWEKLP